MKVGTVAYTLSWLTAAAAISLEGHPGQWSVLRVLEHRADGGAVLRNPNCIQLQICHRPIYSCRRLNDCTCSFGARNGCAG